MAAAICVGGISGCCLNSAVWFGAYLSALSVRDPTTRGIWIYWTATFIGGLLAGCGFHLLFLPQERERDNAKTV